MPAQRWREQEENHLEFSREPSVRCAHQIFREESGSTSSWGSHSGIYTARPSPAHCVVPAMSASPVRSALAEPVASLRALRGSTLSRFLAYVWPYWGIILGATCAGMLKFVLPSTMALSLRFITDRLVLAATGGASSAAPAAAPDAVASGIESYLTWLGGRLGNWWLSPWGSFNLLMLTLVGVYAVWSVAQYYRSQWSQRAGLLVMLNLRADLYRHVQRLSHSFYQERQSGGIMIRLTADVALAQKLVGSVMTSIWVDLVTCAVYMYVLASMDGPLTLMALAAFPLYVASMRRFGPRSKRASLAVQNAMEVFSGDVHERIAGHSLVKAFAAERREDLSFFRRERWLYSLLLKSAHITNLANTVVQLLIQVATLGLVWYGGHRLIAGKTSVGTLVAFILLVRDLYLPISRISEMNTVLHNSLAAIDRIFEVFDMVPSVRNRADAKRVSAVRGRVTFERVTFGYRADQPVVHDVSLDVRPGETIALVGPSGAGKSTLSQLVPRFYDPQRGRVLFDGVDLRELELCSLRGQIGIVAQDTILFSGSVADNVLYAKPRASRAEVERAARAAWADEFIRAMPDGYDTLIGERGAKLSGGQRQRIALARVFLADPRVVILDEATNALDTESEQLVQRSISALLKGRTSIVIAHRLTTILAADRIVVLEAGRIVDVGGHAELLERGGLYGRLCDAQQAAQWQALRDLSQTCRLASSGVDGLGPKSDGRIKLSS
jgi:ATP-binding cassette, subfamily B, putative efflux pump